MNDPLFTQGLPFNSLELKNERDFKKKKKVDKKARATPAYHDMKMKRCLRISAVDFHRILSVSVFVFFLLTFGTNILIKKSQSFLFFRSVFS